MTESRRAAAGGAVALAMLATALPAGAQTGIDLTQIPDSATTFASPVQVLAPPGDKRRLFVVERGGRVWVVRDGARLAEPFVDLSSQVESTPSDFSADRFSENGLASVAFAPDYATTGRAYAFFTDRDLCDPGTIRCDDRLVELRRSSEDPEVADASVRTVLTVPHRHSSIHHGGQLHFGPDGLLWLGTGDGGVGTLAQSPTSLSGKLLRLDPALGAPVVETVARGLRNPFRWAFSGADAVIADVGNRRQEEVDVLAGGVSGADFGWPTCEGDVRQDDGSPCPLDPATGYVPPVLTYAHDGGCSAVTGGIVVRDAALGGIWGRYVYGDFCDGFVRSARLAGTARATEDSATGLGVPSLVAFGEDARCAVYAISLDGPVYRLDPAGATAEHACGPPPAVSASAPPPSAPGDLLERAAPPAADRVPPVISSVWLRPRRLAALGRRAPRGIGRSARLEFRLSEAAAVTLRVYRVVTRRRRVRHVQVVVMRRRMPLGRRTLRLSGRTNGRVLRPGRYKATLRARDAAGNVSGGAAVSFVVVGG